MSQATGTGTSTITYLRPAAFMFLAMLAVFAATLAILTATRNTDTYPVYVNDGVYDAPAPTGAIQHCWDTHTTAVNDTKVTLWDCDNIKNVASNLGVVQCVKASAGAPEPYIYCSTTGSASGANGAGHVLSRRP